MSRRWKTSWDTDRAATESAVRRGAPRPALSLSKGLAAFARRGNSASPRSDTGYLLSFAQYSDVVGLLGDLSESFCVLRGEGLLTAKIAKKGRQDREEIGSSRVLGLPSDRHYILHSSNKSRLDACIEGKGSARGVLINNAALHDKHYPPNGGDVL